MLRFHANSNPQMASTEVARKSTFLVAINPATSETRGMPQLLVPLVTVGKVAHDSGKALHRPFFQPQGHRNVICPESRPALSQVPGFVSQMTFGGGPLRSEEHTSELQSLRHIVCRLL